MTSQCRLQALWWGSGLAWSYSGEGTPLALGKIKLHILKKKNGEVVTYDTEKQGMEYTQVLKHRVKEMYSKTACAKIPDRLSCLVILYTTHTIISINDNRTLP